MRRFAELLTALAEAPHGRARRVWLQEYFSAPAPDRGWAAGWLLGALPAPRISSRRLRTLAEDRVGAEMVRLSSRAIGDVGETVGLVWPGSGDLSLAEMAAGWDDPAALFDRLDAEGRVALARLYAGRAVKGARFGELRDAIATAGGVDPAAVAGALAAEAAPYPGLFRWIEGGPPPGHVAPLPPAITAVPAEAAPPGAREDYLAWPAPPGAAVRVVGGRAFDAEGAPVATVEAADGWGFLVADGFRAAAVGAPLDGDWDAIGAAALLLRRGADWLLWPAAARRAVCPVSFVEIGRNVTLTLAVRVAAGEAPLTKLPAPAAEAEAVARFARAEMVEKFGPVRQVRPGLWAEVAYEAAIPAPRRKCGLALEGARLLRLLWGDGPEAPDISEIG